MADCAEPVMDGAEPVIGPLFAPPTSAMNARRLISPVPFAGEAR
jgi:hypothetical protein